MSVPERCTSAAQVAAASARLRRAGAELQALGSERVCRALSQAVERLASEEDTLGARLRTELRETSGLSQPMIEWCLSTSFASADETSLLALARAQLGQPPLRPQPLAAVVLAGNVCTAALRAIGLPLIAGVPVLAKASSHDDALPRLLGEALAACDPDVARCFATFCFGRDDTTARDALLADAHVVSVYGDDATIAEISAHAPAQARVLAHGHGLSALYISSESLHNSAQAHYTAERAALDVAAYDQRGCLSPHFVLVQRNAAMSARAFAELLARAALPRIETRLPRGVLSVEEKAACLQWRAVAAARGELFEGVAHAVSFEATHALRPSPGARHIGVYECEGIDELVTRLSAFGAHLKCIGVAGSSHTHAQVTSAVHGTRPPRICPAGEMQTPPFDAAADGLPALEGFFTEHRMTA